MGLPPVMWSWITSRRSRTLSMCALLPLHQVSVFSGKALPLRRRCSPLLPLELLLRMRMRMPAGRMIVQAEHAGEQLEVVRHFVDHTAGLGAGAGRAVP